MSETLYKEKISPQKKRNAIISVVLIFALLITGAFAFMTSKDSKANVFTIGKVDIELWENFDANNDKIAESYGPEDGQKINFVANAALPNLEVIKQPYIKNEGTVDAFVYMVVGIPKAAQKFDRFNTAEEIEGLTFNSDGWTNSPIEIYNILDADGNSVKNGTALTEDGTRWMPITSSEIDTLNSRSNDTVYHLFAYTNEEGMLTPLAPNAQTENLFEKIKVNNYSAARVFEEGGENTNELGFTLDENGRVIPKELNIEIYAYAIQTKNAVAGLSMNDTIEIPYTFTQYSGEPSSLSLDISRLEDTGDEYILSRVCDSITIDEDYQYTLFHSLTEQEQYDRDTFATTEPLLELTDSGNGYYWAKDGDNVVAINVTEDNTTVSVLGKNIVADEGFYLYEDFADGICATKIEDVYDETMAEAQLTMYDNTVTIRKAKNINNNDTFLMSATQHGYTYEQTLSYEDLLEMSYQGYNCAVGEGFCSVTGPNAFFIDYSTEAFKPDNIDARHLYFTGDFYADPSSLRFFLPAVDESHAAEFEFVNKKFKFKNLISNEDFINYIDQTASKAFANIHSASSFSWWSLHEGMVISSTSSDLMDKYWKGSHTFVEEDFTSFKILSTDTNNPHYAVKLNSLDPTDTTEEYFTYQYLCDNFDYWVYNDYNTYGLSLLNVVSYVYLDNNMPPVRYSTSNEALSNIDELDFFCVADTPADAYRASYDPPPAVSYRLLDKTPGALNAAIRYTYINYEEHSTILSRTELDEELSGANNKYWGISCCEIMDISSFEPGFYLFTSQAYSDFDYSSRNFKNFIDDIIADSEYYENFVYCFCENYNEAYDIYNSVGKPVYKFISNDIDAAQFVQLMSYDDTTMSYTAAEPAQYLSYEELKTALSEQLSLEDIENEDVYCSYYYETEYTMSWQALKTLYDISFFDFITVTPETLLSNLSVGQKFIVQGPYDSFSGYIAFDEAYKLLSTDPVKIVESENTPLGFCDFGYTMTYEDFVREVFHNGIYNTVNIIIIPDDAKCIDASDYYTDTFNEMYPIYTGTDKFDLTSVSYENNGEIVDLISTAYETYITDRVEVYLCSDGDVFISRGSNDIVIETRRDTTPIHLENGIYLIADYDDYYNYTFRYNVLQPVSLDSLDANGSWDARFDVPAKSPQG